MTDLDLDAITARANAATPDTWVYADDTMQSDGTIQTANVLPVGMLGINAWEVCACSGGPVEPEDGDDMRGRQAAADATFIAHAREDVPALVAAVTEAREAATWATLAAETQRERADQLQDAFDEAPHGGDCAGWAPTSDDYTGDPVDEHMDEDACDCWKAGL